MEYRLLGRTGVRVSELALGTSVLVRSVEQPRRGPIIRRAIEAGINLIDTANVYGEGEAERMVGRAVAEMGGRDRMVIATKLHGNMDKAGTAPGGRVDPNARGSSRRHIIQACEASLQRLGTDYIDLYQFHRPEPSTPIDESLRALDDLIRQGKVRYIGTSTYAAWQLVESLWAAHEYGLSRFVTEQAPYHLLDRRLEREVMPMVQTYGLGLLTWSPLAAGMLSGKYQRDAPRSGSGEGGRLAGDNLFARKPNFRSEVFDVVEALTALAEEKGCTPGQLALAWVGDQPGVTAAIIGCRTLDQLEENLGATRIEITDQDREQIDEIAPPGSMLVAYHDGDWGPHPYRW